MALSKNVAGLQLEVAGGCCKDGEVGEEMRRKMRGCRGCYLCLGGRLGAKE